MRDRRLSMLPSRWPRLLRQGLCLVVALVCGFAAQVAWAQMTETAPMPAATSRPTDTSGVKETQPQLYYLKDKDGNLVPVPDMTFEDFQRLDRLAQGLNTASPTYSLGNLKLTGQVINGKAEIDADLKIKIIAKNEAWQRIPLRFASAALREPPQHEGKGDLFIEYEPDGEGYICWLKAAENSEHTLRCRFLAPVQELGAELRLAIAAPRATSGLLNLRVAEAQAKAVVIRRTEELTLKDVFADGSGSRLEMPNPAGDFQIAWRAGTSTAPQMRQTVDVRSTMLVKMEGKRRVTCEARMKVRSFGAPLEAFTVRLPPDMHLGQQPEQPGLRFTVLEPTIDEFTQKTAQVVEVRLETKTNSADVTMVAEYVRDSNAGDQPVEVGGFEVIDAVKQWGALDLVVEGEQSAIWLEGANIRRMEDAPTADARGVRSLARFEYDAQPFSLQVQAVPRKTRVTVEPLYVVFVEDRQLRLEATLKYQVRGAKAYNVEYDFAGWTVDSVTSPNVKFQNNSVDTERVSPLAIPLTDAPGEFVLNVKARRDLPANATEVTFDVPRPLGSSLTPGSVVIVPANNVELTTRSADLQGLLLDPLPTTLELPPRQQTPQYFRELGGGTTARYTAGMELRQRMVTVATTGQVRLDAGRATVEQRLAYNIAYEPLRTVELDVPLVLWEAGQVQVLLDGTALPVTLLPQPPTAAPTDRAQVRVALMADRIGRLELMVRYELPLPVLTPEPVPENGPQIDRSVTFKLPLFLPRLDGQPLKTNTTLRLSHADELNVTPHDEVWAVSQAMQTADSQTPETIWTHPLGSPQIELDLELQQARDAGVVAVEQAWMQSWLAPQMRQDRAVFRVTTAAERLRIQVPDSIQKSSLVAAINGRSATRRRLDAEGVLTLELPAVTQPTTYVVELWYEFTRGRPPIGVMQMNAPQLLGAGEARRSYWQVILPENEHLLAGPKNLAADMRWRWEGTHFGRSGRMSQNDLERWSGASLQPNPPSGTNTFLFSGFGSLEQIEVRTIARRSVLLACSGLALVAGLALLYLPLARHPLVLVLVGIGIGTLSLWSPDTAVMIAQAAIAGVGCALLARLLQSLYGSPPLPRSQRRQASPSTIEGKSTEAHMRYDPGSQTTTASVPVPAPAPVESSP